MYSNHNPSLTSVKLSLPMWTNPELEEAIAELDKHIREYEHGKEILEPTALAKVAGSTISYLKDKREILQQALNVRNHKVS